MEKQYVIYRLEKNSVAAYDSYREGVFYEEFKPNPFSGIHTFLWSLTKGRGFYKIYKMLSKDGKLLCKAEVVNKSVFIRFLRNGGGYILDLVIRRQNIEETAIIRY